MNKLSNERLFQGFGWLCLVRLWQLKHSGRLPIGAADQSHYAVFMNIDDLRGIETRLGIFLPLNYCEWALLLPPADQETEWQYAFNDPSHIIEENERLRSRGCQGEEWPAELFCVGEADDNHYFISLHAPDHVYYTNHDDGPYFSTASWKTECGYKEAVEFYRNF